MAKNEKAAVGKCAGKNLKNKMAHNLTPKEDILAAVAWMVMATGGCGGGSF